MSGPPTIAFREASKLYGSTLAVDAVTLDIAAGSFTALVGASGSGKTTLLKMVNRLTDPDSGSVLVDGEEVRTADITALRRRIGYVFQGVGLFPHMDVAGNIGIGPRLAGERLPRAQIEALLAAVELGPDYAARMPHQLSGGQRQRIGVARALAGKARILLMDEPFASLDPVTRDALGKRVRALHEDIGLTTLMVTHDMAEALLLADRVLVMEAGRIVADASPHALLAGEGGAAAQALVAVPREQARALAGLAP